MTIRFVLASASPARRETLLRAGVVPEVIVSGVDESRITAGTTAALVQELANAKALVVSKQLRGEALVLGCDSLFEFEGAALGKPASIGDAIAQWQRMRGRTGILHTGHCLIDCAAERMAMGTVSTILHFADVTDEEILVYCSSGEPFNVAGGFTIDGFGGWFVDMIEGDHHNVVGLSLPLLRRLLRELNFGLPDLDYPTP
jgi:septum formation protein